MDKYQLYDNIISATYINISIDAVKNKGIYFNCFNNNSFAHKVFLKVAFMVADFENQKIYLNCKFIDFLKILHYNYSIKEILSGRCKLRFSRKFHEPNTSIDLLSTFESQEFKVDITIFEDIWKEYYL